MENEDQTAADLGPSLWLTPRLMELLCANARLGSLAMIAVMIAGVPYAAMAAFFIVQEWLERSNNDFYLLEDGNGQRLAAHTFTLLMYAAFFRGTAIGLKAFRQLKNAEHDDQDLLEGTERLDKMFKSLVICMAAYASLMLMGR